MPETTPTFSFSTDVTSFKSVDEGQGEKSFYIEGYASTGDLDLLNDIVTPACMKSMLDQIKGQTIMCDIEHSAYAKNNPRPNLVPTAKIVDAKIDHKGLWVKAKLNHHTPEFKSVWGSIKDGFLNAFSITYQPIKALKKSMGDKVVRLLDDVRLLNIAITGNPVNRGAVITNVMAKSLREATEEVTMSEEIQNPPEEPKEAQPAPEPVPEPVPAPAEPQDALAGIKETLTSITERLTAIEAKSQPQASEPASEEPAELKSLADRLTALEAENKSLKESLAKPVLKGVQRKAQSNDTIKQKPNIIGFCM